jgi:hypothetical protein
MQNRSGFGFSHRMDIHDCAAMGRESVITMRANCVCVLFIYGQVVKKALSLGKQILAARDRYNKSTSILGRPTKASTINLMPTGSMLLFFLPNGASSASASLDPYY